MATGAIQKIPARLEPCQPKQLFTALVKVVQRSALRCAEEQQREGHAHPHLRAWGRSRYRSCPPQCKPAGYPLARRSAVPLGTLRTVGKRVACEPTVHPHKLKYQLTLHFRAADSRMAGQCTTSWAVQHGVPQKGLSHRCVTPRVLFSDLCVSLLLNSAPYILQRGRATRELHSFEHTCSDNSNRVYGNPGAGAPFQIVNFQS